MSSTGGDVHVMCVECEDQEAAVRCEQCEECFCRPCYQMQHRKGKRIKHTVTNLQGDDELPEVMPLGTGETIGNAATNGNGPSEETKAQTQTDVDKDEDDWNEVGSKKGINSQYVEQVLRTPVRLSEAERGLFAVLNGALQVSEYTDNVDTLRYGKEVRIVNELEEMFKLEAGLLCCGDFRQGGKILKNLDEFHNAQGFYQTMFEIGRRYKIMNPEKMRTNYGKLMYMLMDAVSRYPKEEIGFNVKVPIRSVGTVLEECGGMAMVQDGLFTKATAPIPTALPTEDARALVKIKQEAVEALKKKYATELFPVPEIERVLYSISDSYVYKDIATTPVRAMLGYLHSMFSKNNTDRRSDLSLRYGSGGSKLNHDHSNQYRFVHQTLTLWLKCTSEMYSLWSAADADMLASSVHAGYRLQNTGQGLQRVQSCPSVSRLMSNILSEVQSECGGWVGLSVVHLGDRDVPNALTFIDKYTQIPRILAPIVQTIESIDKLAENEACMAYFKSHFESPEDLKYKILRDYFKHGFDGSGDDGGSCIDGRLTSNWNWCSRLEKKSYYRVFLMSGFTGFDGDWKSD